MTDHDTIDRTKFPPIVRVADPDAVHDILRGYGWGKKLGLGDILASRLAVPDVRAFAEKLRGTADPELPDRPRVVADALNRLCDDLEARPVDDWDIPNLTEADEALVAQAAQRFRERSPLLEGPVGHLDELLSYPAVCHVRAVLNLLGDIDALIPGADAELRPVLTRYAGLPG